MYDHTMIMCFSILPYSYAHWIYSRCRMTRLHMWDGRFAQPLVVFGN